MVTKVKVTSGHYYPDASNSTCIKKRIGQYRVYSFRLVFQETLLYSTGQKVIHASYSLAKQGSTKAMNAQPIHF